MTVSYIWSQPLMELKNFIINKMKRDTKQHNTLFYKISKHKRLGMVIIVLKSQIIEIAKISKKNCINFLLRCVQLLDQTQNKEISMQNICQNHTTLLSPIFLKNCRFKDSIQRTPISLMNLNRALPRLEEEGRETNLFTCGQCIMQKKQM